MSRAAELAAEAAWADGDVQVVTFGQQLAELRTAVVGEPGAGRPLALAGLRAQGLVVREKGLDDVAVHAST